MKNKNCTAFIPLITTCIFIVITLAACSSGRETTNGDENAIYNACAYDLQSSNDDVSVVAAENPVDNAEEFIDEDTTLPVVPIELPENAHPFAVALVYFLDVIPELPSFIEDTAVSRASAYLIDLDGNGTVGMIAYKAVGNFDNFAIFYLHNGELRTLGDINIVWESWRLREFGESPFITLSGGEGAGRHYNIFSLTAEGLTMTSSLWAAVGGYYYYNDSPVTAEEFDNLLEQYNINDDRWLILNRRYHMVDGYFVCTDTLITRPDDTAAILAMTMLN